MKFSLLFPLKDVWSQMQLGRVQQPSASLLELLQFTPQHIHKEKKKPTFLISAANMLPINCRTLERTHIPARCPAAGQGPPAALKLTPVTAYKFSATR